MYISSKFSGSDTPGPTLLVFSISDRNKRLVNNLCISLNKVKLKMYNYSSYQVNVFYCQYLRQFAVACVQLCIMKVILCHLQTRFCENGKINTKLHAEFKNNYRDTFQTQTLHPNSCKFVKLCLD